MQKINFQNLPNTTTPLNATNMNAIQTNVEDVFNGNEAMGNIIVDSITSKNLISGWYYGGISSVDGSDTTDSTSRKTDYMPASITSSLSYKLSGLQISHCSMFIAAYNANKQFLGRTGAMIQTGTTDLTLTPSSFPSGTAQGTGDIKYLRIVLYTPASGYTIDGIVSSNSNMQLEKGSTITAFSPYQSLGYVSGSNANGNYTKFDDGTLVQWGTVNVPANTSSYEQTFPIQFKTAISVLLTNIYSNSKKVIWTQTIIASKFTAYPMNYEGNSVPTFATSASWIAIGRWK